jgi:hypothetical protein
MFLEQGRNTSSIFHGTWIQRGAAPHQFDFSG